MMYNCIILCLSALIQDRVLGGAINMTTVSTACFSFHTGMTWAFFFGNLRQSSIVIVLAALMISLSLSPEAEKEHRRMKGLMLISQNLAQFSVVSTVRDSASRMRQVERSVGNWMEETGVASEVTILKQSIRVKGRTTG